MKDKLIAPKPQEILDAIISSATSGLKNPKSQDRKLAIKAMYQFVNEWITWQRENNCRFLSDFSDDQLLQEIKQRLEERVEREY